MIPSLKLSPSDVTLVLQGQAPQHLKRRITKALTHYPYCIQLSNLVGHLGEGRRSEIIQILECLKASANPGDKSKVSFTKVAVAKGGTNTAGAVTRYSRTEQHLALHTDSSYSPSPANIMGFQCMIEDKSGGDTILVPLDHVLNALSDQDIAMLKHPIFPFSALTRYPILSGPENNLSIRYYRNQIDLQIENGMALDREYSDLMDRLDMLLADTSLWIQRRMQMGDLILINNDKIMHGRSALSPDSDRMIYRGRCAIDLPDLSAALKPWPIRLLHRIMHPRTHRDHKNQQSQSNINHELTKLILGRQFDQAIDWLLQHKDFTDRDRALSYTLAALYRIADHDQKAAAQLEKVTNQFPVRLEGKNQPDQPNILLIRGLRKARYSLSITDKDYSHNLAQGHFATKALFNPALGNKYQFSYFNQTNWDALNIPKCNVILNTIACADRMQESLISLGQLLDQAPCKTVINHPRMVARTRRDENAANLGAIDGIMFPRTCRINSDGKSPDQLLSDNQALGMDYPLIVRPTVTHTGKYVMRAECDSDLINYFSNHAYHGDYYMIDFIDTANKAGLYNKNRVFCIDGKFYPVAGLHHDAWNIHSGDRYSVMDKQEMLQQWEQAYLADLPGFLGDKGMTALGHIRDAVQLDFFGIDFTKMPNGDLLIFECNPSMRHNFDHAANFDYTAPYLKTISLAFSDMIASRLQKAP